MEGYGGQLVALDLNPSGFDTASPLMNAAKIRGANIENQSNALDLSVKQSLYGARSALASALNNPQATQPPPTPSALIQAAASKASDPDSWDQAMSDLAKTVPEAGQFVGRYTSRLKDSVMASYAPPGGQGGPQSPLAAPPAGGQSQGAPGASPGASGPTSPLGGSLSPDIMAQIRNMSVWDPQGAQQMLSTLARQRYAQTGDPNDLRADPTLQKAAQETLTSKTGADKEKFLMGSDYLGRSAAQALQIPNGPQRVAFWQSTLQQGLHDGQLTPDMAKNHAQYPSDPMLKLTQAGALTIADQARISGTEAENVARKTLPFEIAKAHAAPFNLGPGEQRFTPGVGNVPPTGAVPNPATPPAPAGVTTPASGIAPTAQGANVGDIARQKAQAEQFVKYQGELSDKAASAVTSNADWDNMRASSQTWQQGRFAEVVGDAKAQLAAVAHQFGLPAESYTNSVADWETFNKNAGALLRDAAHQVSSRVGVQEMQLVGRSLPTDKMSAKGFAQIADQMQGINDFVVAKNAAASQFQGTQPQFESQFDKNVSPVAFIVHRMSPENYVTFANNLKKTDAGRAELSKIVSGMQYADQNGLFQAAGR